MTSIQMQEGVYQKPCAVYYWIEF